MSLKNCKEVRLYNKINEWIIFGLLMSLKELANQEVYEMFKSAFANSTYQIIGYGIKVKTADIYAKMADYANALKISHFKSSLKEEIARPITLNRLIAKMTLIVDNINKMTNFLNEAPFNHARYFEITLTALETLGIEIKILAANIDAENMKDALNSLAAKKLFKAIHCLYVLAKSAKKYSKCFFSFDYFCHFGKF
ncbi:hypothetical protein MHBO_002464 [Bonamia ostreae]|uniref:Uncharacterized protein n=1 Tax=Bonamia ostreae TaxID=126728 RepID=A0ABV2AMG7_9EUKA